MTADINMHCCMCEISSLLILGLDAGTNTLLLLPRVQLFDSTNPWPVIPEKVRVVDIVFYTMLCLFFHCVYFKLCMLVCVLHCMWFCFILYVIFVLHCMLVRVLHCMLALFCFLHYLLVCFSLYVGLCYVSGCSGLFYTVCWSV